MSAQVYYIENLTLKSWMNSIWPRLLWNRFHKGPRVRKCYVVDAPRSTMMGARLLGRIAGVEVEKLDFQLVDVKDEDGLLIRRRIAYKDLAEVQKCAVEEPAFKDLVQSGQLYDQLPIFLEKNIAAISLSERGTMWRALLAVQVCLWKTRQEQEEDKGCIPVLFLERRPWLNAITSYADDYGVTIIPVRAAMNLKAILRRWLPTRVIDLLRSLRYQRSPGILSALMKRPLSMNGTTDTADAEISADGSGPMAQGSAPKIAVEYQGQFNLNEPYLHSDLFFWQNSSLSGSDVMLAFRSPTDPLDEAKLASLRQHGMGVVATHPGATTVPTLSHFAPRLGRDPEARKFPKFSGNSLETRWLKDQTAAYQRSRSFWAELFAAYNARVYVTWYKYDALHYAIADALRSLGGIMTIYQRAYESEPSAETTIGADIVFGFSPLVADVERRSNSNIRYHVATGYPGDHRFSALHDSAQAVRDRLKQNGARHIVAYTDENSADDPRWHTGHPFMRVNYSFLLEKVLENPWLGLVIKPKSPRTLRRRLGPVAETLARAEATGRCYVHEGGTLQGAHPPSEAALAADVMIHGHLCAATAGLEAALAGIPTLLIDREGWSMSPLYRLGVGQVVFTDWESLWEACQQHWSTPGGVPAFGDWSSMLEEIDPFRDGRAAERIGTYLKWLIDGFKSGLDREAVMANAAERYAAMWGSDKITQVNAEMHYMPLPTSTGQVRSRSG